jgi:predicted porin
MGIPQEPRVVRKPGRLAGIHARSLLLGGVALACAATASAQSSVQVYGQVGVGLDYNRASGGAASRSVTTLGDNLMWASFLGYSGTEDLGGGLAALFRLESGLGVDTGSVGGLGTGGQKFFNRQSWVGLRLPAAGTVTLGRQFHAATDRVIRTLDVNRVGGTNVQVVPLALFGVNKFVGNDNRVDNSIKYRASVPGVVEAGVSYGMNEKISGPNTPAPVSGASWSMDLAHTTDRYDIGATYIHYDAPTGLANGTTPKKDLWAVGGNVTLGNWRPYLSYFDSTFDSTVINRPAQRNRIWDAGLAWTASSLPVTATLAYYHDKGTNLNGVVGRDGTKQTLVLAAYYALSKRTELYNAYYQNLFSDGYKLEPVNQAALNRTAAQSRVQGVSAGMRHFF